jgi:LPS sulfotransferase NodH
MLPKYVLATTSRVGGHVMSQVMRCLGSGNPHEYFSDYHLNMFINQHPEAKPLLSDYWAYLFRQSSSEVGGDGVFGLKITLSNLFPYIYYMNFPYGFKAWKWIYLYRKDVIAQAISLYIAEITNSWNYFERQDEIEKIKISQFDLNILMDRINVVLIERDRWEIFFSILKISPKRIAYEDIEYDVLFAAQQAREFLGLRGSSIRIKSWNDIQTQQLKKQSSSIYSELRAMFEEKYLSNASVVAQK